MNHFYIPCLQKKSQSRRKQFGQGMTEYIIVVALIAVAAIGVFRLFGDTLREQMGGLAQEMSGQSGSDQIGNAQDAADAAVSQANTKKDLSNYSTGNQK
ncbi:pilus assembly protein [Spongiibacter sp.]|uniref:Flp family type IVb pilin n=1 Tax=Spongiibacter sp. TaxID=2024860 RepID=UPI000C4B5B76|nr:pilus assembly protein [Spongiibacter sp.]MBU72784.1 pilus assembly protein [Spongiibacter sp.]|tara:strand:+ start:503 stop:799 length:297 start_codon:yes stop_codon:yes gene_type:complete